MVTPMSMYGADCGELRRLAAAMTQTADDLDADASALSKTLYRLSWLGDIASDFLSSWTGTCIPRMNLSTNFLRESANELTRHAEEQETASNSPGMGFGEPQLARSKYGDLGGRDKWERRPDWDIRGNTAEERGRDIMTQLLSDTDNETYIAQDEFEIIRLPNGKFIINMPGVIDLSSPHLGYDPLNRSVRDTDQSALWSAGNSEVARNAYAQYVIRAAEKYGIPPGSEIMLAGHSYGADTALDLAADPNFNGPDGYHVTHVMAAAYNSERQMPDVPASTRMLVLQNQHDLPVKAERGLEGPSRMLSGDILGGGIQTQKEILLPLTFGGVTGLGLSAWHHTSMDPGTFVDDEGRTRVVFDGGGEGTGHHQNNYIGYVASTDDKAIREFAVSVGQAGYDGTGIRTAHDVSVPE